MPRRSGSSRIAGLRAVLTSAAGLAAALLLAAPASAAPNAPVGPLVAISATSGSLQGFPQVHGDAVYAIADDGAGGWFVGGEFASAGGVACRNLVHVSSNRTVDRSWCPRPDGTVRALARVGGLLYVGAEGMHRIAGVSRASLAALDIDSGRAVPWNPGTPGRTFGVFQLTPDERRGVLYVTGEFSGVGGKPRHRLAAVSLRTGRATAFAPEPDETSHGDSVVGTLSARGAVYAYGFFSRIGGLPRDSFSRLDPRTGHALATVVSPICPSALLAAGPRLYAGTSPGCEGVRSPLIALTLPSLTPIHSFRPALPRRDVEALGGDSSLVVAVSSPGRFDRGPRLLVGLDAAGHRLFTSPVHPMNTVEAVSVSGGLVLLGGFS